MGLGLGGYIKRTDSSVAVKYVKYKLKFDELNSLKWVKSGLNGLG